MERMTVSEKVSYIKGLAEGLKLNTESPEGKILAAIIDLLGDIALDMEDIDSDLADLTDVVNDLEADVSSIEDEIFDNDEDDDDYDYEDDDVDDEDDMYEITCPNCSNTITAGFSVIQNGQIVCPNCGSTIEFDLDTVGGED